MIAEGNNEVTSSNDPTAHAEITAIGAACAALGKFRLDGCEIYTGCEPCPCAWGRSTWRGSLCTGQNTARRGARDNNWTAYNQTGSYQNLPPAVIVDLDETAIDNSAYEAGLVVNNTRFDPKTWDDWTKAEQAKAVPGAVEFANYSAAKGVKVFYVSNRNADQKEATRHNLEVLGFPMGGNVDTLLMQKDKPEWSTGANGSRFAYIAKDYRALLMFGDQIGDFSDKYNTSLAERDKLFEANRGQNDLSAPPYARYRQSAALCYNVTCSGQPLS
jgi:hypothetical protein